MIYNKTKDLTEVERSLHSTKPQQFFFVVASWVTYSFW